MRALRSLGRFVNRRALGPLGVQLARLDLQTTYTPVLADRQNRTSFLDKVMPKVNEISQNGGTLPPAERVRSYYGLERMASYREILDQCEADGISLDERRILDIGCQYGALLWMLALRYPSATLIGTDIKNDDWDELARAACPRAQLMTFGLWDLPAEPKYDVIFLTQVLEHLEEPSMGVQSLVNCLSEGGVVIVTVPDGRLDRTPAWTYQKEMRSYFGHVNFWSPESWKKFHEQNFPGAIVRAAKLPTGQLYAAITP